VDPEALLELVVHAGEVLLGQAASFSLANYTIGVPASLPTGRFARVSSGITAETFLKRTSIAKLTTEANEALTDAALALAEHEDFPAHAAALRARRP
jgi:histidinol dehydrogenase